MRRGPRASPILGGAVVVLGYVALVAWLTWPLAASMWSGMPAASFACSFDLYYSAWALSHESHALVTAPLHLADGHIYHPTPNALFYGPAAMGALPLFAPAYLATGNPAFAVNVTFLGGLALTGAAMHAVVRRWTGSHLAGIVGATTVLLNQWLFWTFVPSAPHWAPLYGFPLIAFAAATRLGSFRSALWLVPLIALQSLVDLVYVAPVVLGPLGVLAAGLLVRRRTRPAAFRLIAVVGLAVLPLLPVYAGYLRVQAANPDLVHQSVYKVKPDDIYTYAMSIPGDLVRSGFPFSLTAAAMIIIPLGAGTALWRRRSGGIPPIPGGWTQGAVWTVVGLLLSLTPIAMVGPQRVTTPLGYAMGWVPGLQAIRVPHRLGIAGLVGLGILSGVAFGEIGGLLRDRLRRRWLALATSTVLAGVAVAFIYRAYAQSDWALYDKATMPATYPVQPAPQLPAAFVPVLASSRVPLLEVPCGLDGLQFLWHARATFHAILHQHPVLNGYSSYWPAAFAERMAEGSRLPNVDALQSLVESTGLGLVWVHSQLLPFRQQIAWNSPPAPDAIHPGYALVAREGSDLLFAVLPPTSSAARAD